LFLSFERFCRAGFCELNVGFYAGGFGKNLYFVFVAAAKHLNVVFGQLFCSGPPVRSGEEGLGEMATFSRKKNACRYEICCCGFKITCCNEPLCFCITPVLIALRHAGSC
jgi:hypothetical protein